jgi:peptidoglycan/xylan/chitin deacetylase (PgdA/CDA1 family)
MPFARFFLYVTSLGGFAALGLALVGQAPPITWLAAGFGAHVLVATLSVLLPSLGVWARVASRATPGTRRIALTFDDGPNPQTTRRVLALLAERGQRATFFVIGQKALRHPELLREMRAAGHLVGLHGYEHDRLYALRSTRRVRRDLVLAQQTVTAVLGTPARWFRPPIGFVSHAVALAAQYEGVELAGWTARALDGRARARPERVLRRALAAVQDGAVLLLHDAAEADDRAPASLEVLPILLDAVSERGLAAVTLDELFETGVDRSSNRV